ncbi:NADPH-dependent 1-acyl dihydroxyacetone phosphate reductase [Yamadazyma tenuis]|uniref:NAD(P)-binding protein n=1 Tax=Candida tenuis (strain ATCC 10573 / BCRC 21748 / CBS 615 / JCM 9827 / NBRC 10315 / NRRL Y-1498 / VKM Y-70) TaxID=590646 RepID=G3B1Z9_CANTC|nr:NAD(P)-binding protein [Yamadazyma tenuis ATCC 10573]XP_006685836.1 uncharacterized protein CANTEDRAFT_113334 [Yamadazyma tenuis ATCC 10573]EGV65029.1 NAD(P)-binding protein [Yamadazyma tenuis ATCC 10573]EGV65030.1 hypothetical protein CANTEDRAFT_113334 [Yamadazyma tenuis ATCC 10573]WEJ97337.1 NADPH-dependent 1-acyl dihydroxyacetone phosphate reductase [Yamadazyma tenuis]
MSTKHQTVVVTGASSGIGLATAKEFASRGYTVIAGARRVDAMEELRKLGVITVSLDVTSPESVQSLKELIKQEYDGEIQYLFNNAGQSCTFPAIDVSDENMEKCFAVNVFGQVRVTRELVPFLIKTRGTVGFTGSVSGFLPFPFSSIYSSTKAAIHEFASTLAFELEPFDVKVINIITGGVDTDIADKRPLPEDSWYSAEGIEELISKRREMAKRNAPMSAELYAQKVVSDFEGSRIGVINYYRGSKASILHVVSFFPRFWVTFVFRRMFGMVSLWQHLREKYSK